MLENLDRLKVFYYVFTSGSIVSAAEKLHVSQSAVSQTVQKLEKEIKTHLFTRLHKQLVPTAAGKKLYAVVQPFMESVDEVIKDLAVAKKKPFGELHVGSPPEFGKAYLPAIVAGFRKKYPEVTFDLKLGSPEKLLPLLCDGHLDFTLVDVFLTQFTHIGHLHKYHFRSIVEEEVILACSSKFYTQYIKDDHSFETLIRQNFISYRKDQQVIKQWFGYHFSKSNVTISDVLTVDSHEAVISAIKNDVGLGVVSSHLISNYLDSGEIIPIKVSDSEIINSIALVYLQDKTPTFTEKVFENHLISEISKTISQGISGMKVLVQ